MVNTSHILLVLFQVFLWSYRVGNVYAEKFRWYCDISSNPVVELAWDDDIGSFMYTEDTGDDINVGVGGVEDTEKRIEGRKYGLDRFRRNLRGETITWSLENAAYAVTSSKLSSHRRVSYQAENATIDMEEETQKEEQIISKKTQARLCHCADPLSKQDDILEFYCPLMYSHCAVPSHADESRINPGCTNQSKSQTLVDRIWPLIVVGFGVTLSTLLGTSKGWHAINHCINACYPSHNESIANHLLRRNRYLATIHILNYLRDHCEELGEDYLPEYRRSRRRRRNSDEGAPEEMATHPTPPSCLTLKTRIYRARSSSVADSAASTATSTSEEEKTNSVGDSGSTLCSSHQGGSDESLSEEGDHACTICFAELLPGDRVGALACNHVFHVECLKEWLTCRNVCPLCLQENVATLQHQTSLTTSSRSTASSEQEENGSEILSANDSNETEGSENNLQTET